MAKTTGPLYSMGASGKIGNALVFFPWKGRNAVRSWVIPVNRMTTAQGDTRVELGGTGRAVGKIKAFVFGTSTPTAFAAQLVTLGVIPAGQTKQSFLVKYIKNNYLMDSIAYGTELTAYIAHTAHSSFESAASGIGLFDFSLPYAGVATYQKGFGLYEIAQAAIALGFTGSPYTTALASWTSSEISAMLADFVS